MQRPTRILIFAIFCLIVGVVSGFKNTMEAGLTIAGPDALEQMLEIAQQQQGLPEVSEMSFRAEIAAQRKPVYRIGQAVESTASMVMALVLIAAGIGLLRDRPWALKLTKAWAYFAIPAAVVSVVLSVRYALPELPDAPTGGAMLNAAFMLIMLWAFPVLLLRHLPTAPVKAYLADREQQRTGTSPMPANTSAPSATATPHPTPPPATHAPAVTRPDDMTWRDDPWNDPSSN